MGRHSGGPDGPFQHQPAGQYEAPGQNQPPRERHTRRNIALGIGGALVVILGIAFATVAIGGSGPGAVTAVRYSSANQVIVALDRGDLRCAGAQYSTPPVVSGATSEASCNFSASESPFIDVFPGTVTTAMVLRNSVSAGTEKIWSDVGPNWWVQSTRAYVKRVQKILGGRVVGGPWHPSSASQSAPAPATSAPAAASPSCAQRVQDWKGTRGAQAVSQALTVLQSISADGQAGNFAATAADLDQLGAVATTMQGNPVPSCADGHHYWRKMTRAMQGEASEAAGVASEDTASIQQATVDNSRLAADTAALIRELKQEGP
jgi:hypothetical protein